MADIKTDIVTCRLLVDESVEMFENVSFYANFKNQIRT